MKSVRDEFYAILEDTSISIEERVYKIGRQLAAEGHIDKILWYAILEMKDKHIREFKSTAFYPFAEEYKEERHEQTGIKERE